MVCDLEDWKREKKREKSKRREREIWIEFEFEYFLCFFTFEGWIYRPREGGGVPCLLGASASYNKKKKTDSKQTVFGELSIYAFPLQLFPNLPFSFGNP